MMIQKKDRFRATYDGKVYEVAGKWHDSLILSPIDQTDEQCLLYTLGEMEELLELRKFQRAGGRA